MRDKNVKTFKLKYCSGLIFYKGQKIIPAHQGTIYVGEFDVWVTLRENEDGSFFVLRCFPADGRYGR